MYEKCPCLTRYHTGDSLYYAFSKGRHVLTNEYFALQGYPRGRIVTPDNISERQIRQMIGNSFCVPVIAMIADRLLFAVGLTDSPKNFTVGSGSEGNTWPQPRPAGRRPLPRAVVAVPRHVAAPKAKAKALGLRPKAKAGNALT